MATTPSEHMIPTIFNDIIRKRVADYMDKELKEMMRQKMDSIISEVLGNLQADTKLFKDMARFETKMVVTAIYNGKDVEQHPSRESLDTK
jgi:hypothetical protein